MKTQRTKDMERIKAAIDLSFGLHSGQKDKCGQPYWIHPFTVAMRSFTGYNKNDASHTVVGLLHDTIEDANIEIDKLKLLIDLTEEEIEALTLLTHNKDIPYDEYIDSIINSGNKLAMEVKLDDLLHNMNRERFEDAGIEMTEKDIKRYEKYKKAFDKLLAKVMED